MQAQVGDELTVKGHHQGDENHHGEIIEVIGEDGAPPYMVRWRDGFESLFFIRPRPGSATVQDGAPDTRGHALLIHHPSSDGTEAPPGALVLVCAGRRRNRRRLDRLIVSVRPGHDQHRPGGHVQAGPGPSSLPGGPLGGPQRFLRAVGGGHDRLC